VGSGSEKVQGMDVFFACGAPKVGHWQGGPNPSFQSQP
jgi:hypothetical protein